MTARQMSDKVYQAALNEFRWQLHQALDRCAQLSMRIAELESKDEDTPPKSE